MVAIQDDEQKEGEWGQLQSKKQFAPLNSPL